MVPNFHHHDWLISESITTIEMRRISRVKDFIMSNGGSVTVIVVSGEGLVPKDINLFRKNTSDPYIRVLAGVGREVGRTAVVKKTLSPSWNETFNFDIGPKEQDIVLALFDHDKIGNDEPMGRVIIPVSSLSDGIEVTSTLTVQNCEGCKNASGTVTVKAQFAPISIVHLNEGQSLTLEHTSLMVGLGWDCLPQSHPNGIDLDASCVMFDQRASVVDAVYFGSLKSQRGGVGAVVHVGDSETGEEELGGDDERMLVNLGNVDRSVVAMFFVITAYTENTFLSEVSQAYVRLLGMSSGSELCRFSLDQRDGSNTALVMCRLARAGDGSWVLNAVGDVDTQARNYGYLIPRLKEQLRDLVPDVNPSPSDRIAVLRKGQGMRINDVCDSIPASFTLGLQWDITNGVNIDLDASCIMLDSDLNKVDLVYFGQLQSHDGSVRHGGDERSGASSGDDEKIFLKLPQVNPRVSYLGFVINSYSGQELDDVDNARVHLYDTATQRDVCVFELSGDRSLDKHTALVVCVLCRVRDEWCFEAVGEAAQGRTANENVDELQNFLLRRQQQQAAVPPPPPPSY